MLEQKNNTIDQQQEALLALTLPDTFKPKFSPDHYKAIYRDGVDRAQSELIAIGEALDEPEAESFIDISLDSISGKLQELAQKGLAIKNSLQDKKKSSQTIEKESTQTAVEFKNLTQALGNEIAKADQEAAKWQTITKEKDQIDTLILEKKELMSHSEEKTAEEKQREYKNMIGLFDQVEAGFDPTVLSILNKGYFEEQQSHLSKEREELITAVKLLTLRENPEKYLAFAQEQLKIDLEGRIHDPALLTATMAQFTRDAGQFLVTIKDIHDDQELTAKLAEFEESFEAETPFDVIPLPSEGKNYLCHYNPPEKFKNYEKCKQQAQKTLEMYEYYLHTEILKSRFNGEGDSFEFINGTITITETTQKNSEREVKTLVMDGYNTNFKTSNEPPEFQSFSQSFETWKNNHDSTTGFQYGDPPKLFDASIYLQTTQKSELTLDLIRQNPPPELQPFIDRKFKTKNKDIVYEKKAGTLVRTGEIYTAKSIMDKDFSEIIEKHYYYNNKGEVIRSEIETTNKNSSQGEIKKEKQSSQWEKGRERIRVSKNFTNDIEDSEMVAEYDKEGHLVKCATTVAGISNVVAVDYAGGKTLVNTTDKTEGNFTRILEVTDANGVKHIIKSYPEMLKEKPGMTKSEYCDLLAKMFPDDQTSYALGELAFKYVNDSPNPKKPMEDGTEGKNGDFWQLAAETVSRTTDGQMKGDCDDKAFLFDAKNKAAGRMSYVVKIPGHAENIVIELDQGGMWHATSYGTFGVDRDGNRVGHTFDPVKAKGYKTLKEALTSINEKWVKDGRFGQGIFFMRDNAALKEDENSQKIQIMDIHLPIEGRGSDLSHIETDEKIPSQRTHIGWTRMISLGKIEEEIRERSKVFTPKKTKPEEPVAMQ